MQPFILDFCVSVGVGKQVKATVLRFIESAVIRAGPGLLNLLALGLLAERLTKNSYGTYSTTFATATTLGSILLGPIIYGVLPEYNKNRAGEDKDVFIGLIIGSLSIAFVFTAILMLILPGYSAAILATSASGGMTALQELLRGQLRLWSYGAVAFAQSVTFVLGIFFLINYDTPDVALWIYASSCVLGISIAFSLLGFPKPHYLQISKLKGSFRLGGIYTISTLVESSFTIGTRYIFLAFGTRESLAIYSFCIDISQRLVGVMINLATFQFVPRAYKRAEEAGNAAFLAVLRQGAGVGMAAAVASMLLIVGSRQLGFLPPRISALLDPAIFVLVSLGLSVNRLKKLLIDPVALRFNKAHFILIGYIAAAPITFASIVLTLWAGYDSGVAVALMGGYLLATFIARFGYRRVLTERKQAPV